MYDTRGARQIVGVRHRTHHPGKTHGPHRRLSRRLGRSPGWRVLRRRSSNFERRARHQAAELVVCSAWYGHWRRSDFLHRQLPSSRKTAEVSTKTICWQQVAYRSLPSEVLGGHGAGPRPKIYRCWNRGHPPPLGRVNYLPNHPVFNPNKPGFRIAFDVSSRFQGPQRLPAERTWLLLLPSWFSSPFSPASSSSGWI